MKTRKKTKNRRKPTTTTTTTTTTRTTTREKSFKTGNKNNGYCANAKQCDNGEYAAVADAAADDDDDDDNVIGTTASIVTSAAAAAAERTVADADGCHLWVDPRRVRFQHSRIRPTFSGCGRSVQSTLDSIRAGRLSPYDLPPITVLVGPENEDDEDEDEDEGGECERKGGRLRCNATGGGGGGGGGCSGKSGDETRWYYSLNNRRLWVLKRCREEGLLSLSPPTTTTTTTSYKNRIRVRARPHKSEAEKERYTVRNCALEAKFVREGRKGGGGENGRCGNRGCHRLGPAVEDSNGFLNGASETSRDDDIDANGNNMEALSRKDTKKYLTQEERERRGGERGVAIVATDSSDSENCGEENYATDGIRSSSSSSSSSSLLSSNQSDNDNDKGGDEDNVHMVRTTANRFALCGFDDDDDSDDNNGSV